MALQTPHFYIQPMAGDADTLGRAQAIFETCERDLAIVQKWFNVDFDLSPHSIMVYVNAGKHLGGAFNFGYETDESSRIVVVGTYAPAGSSIFFPPPVLLRDELARMVFVAELAEILMDASGQAWLRGDSMGEGLSIFAAQAVHPTGYYATGEGPRIKQWLNSARADFVTNSEGTDQNFLSFGCATLFINYLRYQLLYPIEQIVAAAGKPPPLEPRASLANVFETLTGRPASSAFGEFSALIAAHVPIGQPFFPLRDNIFPLRDVGQRAVSYAPATVDVAPEVRDPHVSVVHTRAGFLCEAKIYEYHVVAKSVEMTLTARAWGFAQPAFTWTINGITATPTGASQVSQATFHVTDTTPGGGEAPVDTILQFQFLVTTNGTTSTLRIRNSNSPGNGPLSISVSAVETGFPGETPAVYTDTPSFVTRRYDMGADWTRDVQNCNRFDLGSVHLRLRTVVDLLHPDEDHPDIDPALVRTLALAARDYVKAIDVATQGSAGLQVAAAKVLLDASRANTPLTSVTLRNPLGGLPLRITPMETPAVDPATGQAPSVPIQTGTTDDF